MRKPALSFTLAALCAALLLAAFVSPFASNSPDGLEKVATQKGFLEKGEGAPAWRHALVPDYALPGIKSEKAATGLAGLLGTGLVFGVGLTAARLASARRRARPAQGSQS